MTTKPTARELREHELMQMTIDKWGEQSQLDKVVEECAELIQAIQKIKRYPLRIQDVIEESVDVELCIEQLKIIFPQTILREHFRKEKLQRLENLLKDKNGKA